MTKPDRSKDPTQFADDDPVARLIVHYFYPADLLRRDFRRAEGRRKRLKGYGVETERQCYLYMRLWFAGIYTVVEGYRDVGLRHGLVDALLAQDDLLSRLRLFRNGAFHYQDTPRKLTQFFEHPSLDAQEWVEHLHGAFCACFNDYRTDVVVRNILAMPDTAL